MASQNVEYFSQVCDVVLPGSTICQDIIEEYDNKFAEQWLENLIHCHLEGRRRIRQIERHYGKFVMP